MNFMRVTCIKNEVAAIEEAEVRDRIRRSIHIDGPMSDLAVGREYSVQALEERDGGLWLYLHTVAMSDYPYPYPAEMFEVQDNILLAEWCIRLQVQRGNIVWKLIAFCEWVNDEHFYERLVDGDVEAISLYQRSKIGS